MITATVGALVAAGLLGRAAPAVAASHEIAITDSAFGTSALTVRVGDTVTWNNADDRPHTVTSDDGTFDSGNLDEGGSFSFTFTDAGTYRYICAYHPEMVATIVVEAAAGAAEPTITPTPVTAPSSPHAGGHAAADGAQPDTAVESPSRIPALAWLLWGMGLVTLGIGLAPRVRPAARVVARPHGGWRR